HQTAGIHHAPRRRWGDRLAAARRARGARAGGCDARGRVSQRPRLRRGPERGDRLVASLNRPGGNVTGVTHLGVELLDSCATATTVAGLLNPTFAGSETQSRNLRATARKLGLQLHLLHASAVRDFDMVFETMVRLQAAALVICPDAFFLSGRDQIAGLAVRHAIPTAYHFREFAAAGGLMSYGPKATDGYRQVGIYAGRILQGEKPADLPVQAPTKYELVINLRTAKALGITVPRLLLGRADELIE